ncbi:hypothetical protein [Glaciecola sp. 1036]|uniref:hypothetical protein n=1 Tax=Alteromonadaceae TaxID=72275 RepID=UPI003D082477
MKLFVNDLTVMDFSYLCPERGMVGESWIVDVVLDGGLNDESMIQDFGIVKKQLKRLMDDHVDHKLVVPADFSGTQVHHNEQDQRVEVLFTPANNAIAPIYLNCPPEAYAFVYSDAIDMASVVAYLKDIIATHLPENVQGAELYLRAEKIDTAFYHYTHGLKKHDGNCQRIAHGHRSKIQIFTDNSRNAELEEYWANKWQDIYIGSSEDLTNVDQITRQLSCSDIGDTSHYAFQYEASQGQFSLIIPKSITDVIAFDSTVECLAQHLYTSIKATTDGPIQVWAYEGVGKGAIVSED